MRGICSAAMIAAVVGCGGTQENANEADPGTIARRMRDPAQAVCSGGPSITIQSVGWDNPGSALTGMSVTVQQGGVTLASGSTPFTVADLCSGESYTITVADDRNGRFAHWENGAATASRTVTLQTSSTYVAYYQVGGAIIPLYSWPTDSSGNVVAAWNFVASEHQKWPAIAVIPIVNNQNGPGPSFDPNWAKGIAALVNGGCKVAGYVYTQYGKRSLTRVETDIKRWRTWYPQVTALFLDEMRNTAGKESYYSTLTSYATSNGFDFVVGNPGTSTIPSYLATVDALVIYENTAVPTSFSPWQASYSPNHFATLSYAVSSSAFPASQVTANRSSVAYQYVTDDGAPPDRNPWDSVSTYLDTLLSLLSP
jgi:hypothetical protein